MSLNQSEGLIVFTDGSASTHDRTGGWAWVALDAFGGRLEDSGWAQDTTISRMELMAPAMALRTLEPECGGPCEVIVQSDSQYVVLGFMDPTRARRKNQDLWSYLDKAADLHDFVEMEHLRGHQGHQWNERADHLAGEARQVAVRDLSASR